MTKYNLDGGKNYTEYEPWWVSLPFGRLIKAKRDKKEKARLKIKFETEFEHELAKTEAIVKYCRENDLTEPEQWAEKKIPIMKQIELLYIASVNLATNKIKQMQSEADDTKIKAGK